jgi:hypothetical protein
MKLPYTPENVGNIAVLQNIAVDHNEEEEYEPDMWEVAEIAAENNELGMNARNNFIANYF